MYHCSSVLIKDYYKDSTDNSTNNPSLLHYINYKMKPKKGSIVTKLCHCNFL